MTVVYLLRHGEADYRPIDDRGWSGATAELAPLSDRGVLQAVEAAGQLSAVGATALVSSPVTRALQTAGILASRLGLLVTVQFELREWLPNDAYTWRSLADVRAALTDFDSCGGEWPAGERRAWEPLSAVRARTSAALHKVIADPGRHDVLIAVCHEMVIRSLTGQKNTGTGQWRRIDAAHLDGAATAPCTPCAAQPELAGEAP